MTKKQIVTGARLMVVSAFGIGLFYSPVPNYGYVGASELECSILPQDICDAAGNEDAALSDSGIWALLLLVLRLLTIGIGIVAVASITYAGFLYATAQESAEQTKKSKEMITNTVIGLIAFALMWALLEYLIPGGVFV